MTDQPPMTAGDILRAARADLHKNSVGLGVVYFKHCRIGHHGYDVRYVYTHPGYAHYPGAPMLFVKDLASIAGVYCSSHAFAKPIPRAELGHAYWRPPHGSGAESSYRTVLAEAAVSRLEKRQHPAAPTIVAWLKDQDWRDATPFGGDDD